MNDHDLTDLFARQPTDSRLTTAGVVASAERSRRTRTRATAGVLTLVLVAGGVGGGWWLTRPDTRLDPAVPSVTSVATPVSATPAPPSATRTPGPSLSPSATPSMFQPARRCTVALDQRWRQAITDAPGGTERRLYAPDRSSWVSHEGATITLHEPNRTVPVTTQADAMYGLVGYDGRYVLYSDGERMLLWDGETTSNPLPVSKHTFPGDGENRAYLADGLIWLVTHDADGWTASVGEIGIQSGLSTREIAHAPSMQAGPPVERTLQLDTGEGYRRYSAQGVVSDWPGWAKGRLVNESLGGGTRIVRGDDDQTVVWNPQWAGTLDVAEPNGWADYVADSDAGTLLHIPTGATLVLPQEQWQNQTRYGYYLHNGMLEITDMAERPPTHRYVDVSTLTPPGC